MRLQLRRQQDKAEQSLASLALFPAYASPRDSQLHRGAAIKLKAMS
jgi:hypothetical protein